MNDTYILAVSSYGSQRVTDPQTRKTVSAHKIGYSSAASAILLGVLGDKARNASPSRASYHYIHITADLAVRHGYLLLKLTAAELAKAERIARNYHRAGACLWRDNRWMELPNKSNPNYSELGGYSKPDFNPTGMLITDAGSGEKEAAADTITVEKSQRDPNEKPWWWILGATYPHREILKRYGARFSSKRKAWYVIAWQLPPQIEALVRKHSPKAVEPTKVDEPPCSVEEAASILGVTIATPTETAVLERLFQQGAVIYARHDLETPDGKAILNGTAGKIMRLYNHNPKHGWSYDVEFEGIGTGWYFERELTDLPSIPGIQIKRGAVVPPGTEQPETDAEIKQNLTDAGQKPEPGPPETKPEEPPAIRIIKPQSLKGETPDAIQLAIQQTRSVSSSTAAIPQHGKKSPLARIAQQPVGEITGSITGSVWCYGYATHEGECVYLNMGGPRTAVEAMRARLSKGEIVNMVPWDASAVELTAGEGNTGCYTAYLQNIPEAKFMSAILVHDMILQPNYSGKSRTFIFQVSEEQAMAQLKHHITQLVKVPVFDAWTGYLWTTGQAAMLIRKTRCEGGLVVLFVDLDCDSWTRLITGGIEQRIIQLPNQ